MRFWMIAAQARSPLFRGLRLSCGKWLDRQAPERGAPARPGDTDPRGNLVQRPVRGTDQVLLVLGQEAVGRKIQWMALVHAVVLVGMHLRALAHDEAAERPVTLAS